MKRLSEILFALLLFRLIAGTALAEGLAQGEALSVDLDGDGSQESVLWEMAPGEYDSALTVTVTRGDGTALRYPTPILWGEAVYLEDLDGDGVRELLLTGDEMSEDYCTYCLRYEDGELYEVLFPDSGRGDNIDAYYRSGYGQIVSIDGDHITLSGSQDVLGTWFATRTLVLTAHDRFEFDDSGLWIRDLDGLDAESLWEYGTLTVTAPLPYADLTGVPAGTLQPGTRILIYASDKRENACFATPDGLQGVLSISTDYERGWGWLVDGLPEEDCFQEVPYAD